MAKQTGRNFLMYALIVTLVMVCIAMFATSGRDTILSVTRLESVASASTKTGPRPLRVMSFNIAHGSKNMFGVVPLFRRASTIKKRLRAISAYIKSKHVDVVGFQEADGPSWWSGRFHHVNFVARQAGFPYAILGIHVKTKRKRYGTALISRLAMSNAISHRFKPLSYFKKGLVVATIAWPGMPKRKVDVISLHLDPRKQNIQASQLREVVSVIKKRKNPAIVMGDFNTTWFGKNSPLKVLVNELGLKTYRPFNPYLFTHHFPKKRRIDWIFLSPELEFVRHKILKVKYTDHYPVMADIRWKKSKPAARKAAVRKAAPAARTAVRKAAVRKAPVVRKAPTSRPAARKAPASRPASRPAAR
jgi:endonuclease/exonuclease/phosphatase family metal-dependent hydrolase